MIVAPSKPCIQTFSDVHEKPLKLIWTQRSSGVPLSRAMSTSCWTAAASEYSCNAKHSLVRFRSLFTTCSLVWTSMASSTSISDSSPCSCSPWSVLSAAAWIPVECRFTNLMYLSPPITWNDVKLACSVAYICLFWSEVNSLYLRNPPTSTNP